MSEETKVQYRNPHEMLISLLKTYFSSYVAKNNKHYSFDSINNVFIPYNREIKPGIHLTLKDLRLLKDSNGNYIYVDLGDKRFNKMVGEIEVCVDNDCENIQIEFLEYNYYSLSFADRNEKKAWAIAFREAEKIMKQNSDIIVFPQLFKAKKSKWDTMYLIAIPKTELEKFDKIIWSKIKKEEIEEGEVEEIESERIQVTGEELEIKPISEEKKIEVEEKVEEKKVEEKKEQLVEVYVLSFELPSYGLAVMKREFESNETIIREINEIERELARKIENLRRSFYNNCDKLFETSTLGWITVSTEGIKFAEEWNEIFTSALKNFAENYVKQKMNQLTDTKLKELYAKLYDKLLRRSNRRIVKAVKIYLEHEDAKELLNEIVTRLNDEILTLKERIKKAEEEKKKQRLRNLNVELNVKLLKLRMFEEKLKSIE